ncbi:MAG: alpha/beta hydrolase [Moraxellaceae bacterium]|nr:alpha/beta hydrolase [Moraxellaceae bacterium]
MLFSRIHARKWMRRCQAPTLALLAGIFLAPAMAGAAPSHDYRVVEDLRYTPPGWPAQLSGDLYLPERGGLLPVVLVVHGGSWKGGDRTSFDATRIAKHLATQGYAAFSVDYRLAPETLYPAPLDDLQQALAWLRANAAAYRLDPESVSAWGYSAGAHLVAMLGTKGNDMARLRAVVAGGTPADLAAWPDSSAVKTFLGKSAREDREMAAAASPINHISATAAPFFLYHGATDKLVEPDQARRFAEALAARGVPVEVHYLRHFGHLLTALFPGKAMAGGVTFLNAWTPTAASASAVDDRPVLESEAL